jgi:hypothetical protein
VTYGDAAIVSTQAGDLSTCVDAQRPKAPRMALPDGIVDVDEPNVEDPKASCGGDTSFDEELVREGVILEVVNWTLDKGKGAPAEELVDR